MEGPTLNRSYVFLRAGIFALMLGVGWEPCLGEPLGQAGVIDNAHVEDGIGVAVVKGVNKGTIQLELNGIGGDAQDLICCSGLLGVDAPFIYLDLGTVKRFCWCG